MRSVVSVLRPEKSLWWERFVKELGFKLEFFFSRVSFGRILNPFSDCD